MGKVLINNNSNKKRNTIMVVSILILFIILAPRFFFFCSKIVHYTRPIISAQHITNITAISSTPTPPILPFIHVNGTQIIDMSGHPVQLRGTVVSSALADLTLWKKNVNSLDTLNKKTFDTIASWHMNTIQLPISQWVYESSPSAYFSQLDKVIYDAHQSKLYIILSFDDSIRSGSPYKDGMLHAESLSFWKILTAHYQNDSMILFDPITMPTYPDWHTWQQGNNLTVRGYQAVIDTIRSANGKQPIIIEPLVPVASSSADAGWKTYPSLLQDTNLIYGLSITPQALITNPNNWDDAWGSISTTSPIFYMTWEVSPSRLPCYGLTSANAETITNNFLTYISAQHASWTAGDFSLTHLIQEYSSFTPTSFTLDKSWTCGSVTAKKAGMGETIRNFLMSH